MATVNYLYRSNKPVAALTIRLLFRHNNKDYVIGARTRCIIPKPYWENYHNAQRVKDAKIKALQASTKTELFELENHVLTFFYKSSIEIIDKNWLKDVVESFYRPQLENDLSKGELLAYIDSYIKIKGNDLANSTIKKYGVVKNMLFRFELHIGRKLHIKDINLSFKQDFEKYCFEQEYAPNTIAKAFKIVKTICNHAKKRGVPVSLELDEVKLKPVDTDTLYLTLEDIEIIENLTGISDYLDNARDWLLISCYTGQRISDFMRFDKSMITKTVNNKGAKVEVIQFKQSKTNSPVSIPLHQNVLEILDKRDGRFPRKISDQKYNLFIKDVCRKAGLTYSVHGSKKMEVLKAPEKRWRKRTGNFEKWELVSSHIGRRSFATNNYGVIPTSALAYATGHKSEAMFLKYMGKNSMDMALVLADYFTN